ncbi:cytochrome P450 monooxygenase-like protein [Lentithecium fluviatile CBS 122367]|uniref:Cytochrome P450 monooxygenase-like protein n=1 Tax=Lentithecium fluviatile CBS 122367 TaxID=1168545 RepID=A0A6G1J3V6_9PLEO|nr:cytochrome P450 monooxygenase-like protein [Lentithecium fluviatile CBS 122367]
MPLSYILSALIALPASFAAWTACSLLRNYIIARSTKLPITIRYISPASALWMIFSPIICHLASFLPFTASFVATYRRGWEARERCRPHLELGDLFIICTPGGNWLKVANSEVANDILKRKDEFGRDLESFEVLNIYGKNLATTEGSEWQRHRKVAAVTFTERNCELVWRESLKEGAQMLEYWSRRAHQPIRTVAQDARVFTLNVLAAALFDKSYPFESRSESEAREKSMSGEKGAAFGYRDSLSTILRMIVPIMVLGENKLRDAWWLPFSWRKAGHAVSDFRSYVTKLIDEERTLIVQGKQNSPNLVTNLVRACEEIDNENPNSSFDNKATKPRREILTKDEIISDLFVFAFAGNDTTAITLTYILGELAAHPEIQDWISEEIQYYTDTEDIEAWNYTTCTKLKRCWAVVYETLRISHPLGQLVKSTGFSPRTISHNSRSYIIPANVIVEVNMAALHTHPQYWGSDSLTWNPRRFVTGSTIEEEVLPPDTADSFIPWAFGRNVCPGKRFSQVELVAVLAALFRDYRVEPVPEAGESLDEARARVGMLAEDAEMRLLNEMREPEKVGVRWRRVR